MAPYSDIVVAATPQRMLDMFPDLEPLQDRPSSSESSSKTVSENDAALAGHDQEQIRLMNEACICVDYNDVPYAAGSKKTLHLMTSIENGLLHRAFSVFMFNEEGKLLLQQRATEKITFPDLWTNTCCSHPLAVSSEMDGIEGAKVAAIRKLNHELGIAAADVPQANFDYLTRIHYVAPSSGVWGEHEIDYILFIKAPNAGIAPNLNEVRDVKWVSQEELKQLFLDPTFKFTPWFRLIYEKFLDKWWSNTPAADNEIHRMI